MQEEAPQQISQATLQQQLKIAEHLRSCLDTSELVAVPKPTAVSQKATAAFAEAACIIMASQLVLQREVQNAPTLFCPFYFDLMSLEACLAWVQQILSPGLCGKLTLLF